MREDREQYVWWWLTNVGPWFALLDGPPLWLLMLYDKAMDIHVANW